MEQSLEYVRPLISVFKQILRALVAAVFIALMTFVLNWVVTGKFHYENTETVHSKVLEYGWMAILGLIAILGIYTFILFCSNLLTQAYEEIKERAIPRTMKNLATNEGTAKEKGTG